MKILFSNLPWWANTDGELRQGIRAGSRWPFSRIPAHAPGQFQFGGYLPVPFFLTHAAGWTQTLLPGSEVVVRDSIARGETYSEFGYFLQRFNPKWVVVETATPSWPHDQEVIRRMIAPLNMKVLLCGTLPEKEHANILNDFPCVHAILMGEYDKLVAKAINGQRGVYQHDLLSVTEMLFPPFPVWDEACLTNYWDGCPVGHQPPQLQMWDSRGCPYKCCFCVWPAVMTGNDPLGESKRSVRFHSPEYVETYIQHMLNQAPYQSIYLDSDTFNLNQNHTRKISEVMKRIGLPWSAMCRADTIDRDTWRLMKDCGCFGVKIGFESGSQWVIDHIVNKKLDIAAARDTCHFLQHELGMSVHTTWTIGLPGEKPEHVRETMQLIEAMTQDWSHSTHQLSGTATITGTPLDHIAQGEKLAKYDGATNEGFIASPDGQMKVEKML